MPYASVAASAEVEVYANWAVIMVRMTHGSVGADPWAIVQNKLHPAVAEPEFYSIGFFVHESIIERKAERSCPQLIRDTRPDCSCPERSQSCPDRRSLGRECCRLHTQIKALSDPPNSDGFWPLLEVVGCCIVRLLSSSSSR